MRLLLLLISVAVLVVVYFLWLEDFLLQDNRGYEQVNSQVEQMQGQVGEYKETTVQQEQAIMRELDKMQK